MTSRLSRFAAILQGLATLSLFLLPIVLVAVVFVPDWFWGEGALFTSLPDANWPWTTWMGIGVFLVPYLLALLSVDAMRRLFRLYRLGNPLDPSAGPLIHRIGLTLLASAVSGVILMPAYTGLLSLTNPAGERSISIGVGTGDIGFILVAGLLMLIGWSMSEAQKIVAENREFI